MGKTKRFSIYHLREHLKAQEKRKKAILRRIKWLPVCTVKVKGKTAILSINSFQKVDKGDNHYITYIAYLRRLGIAHLKTKRS